MQHCGVNAAQSVALWAALLLLLGAATARARPTRSLQQFDCTAAQQLCEKQECKGKLEFKCDTATAKTDCTCISAGLADCFSGRSTVATPAGPKQLSQLQLGDAVLSMGAGGVLQYSPVFMWSSRRPAQRAAFVRVRTDAGLNLTVTPGHYLFAWRGEGAQAEAEAALGSPSGWPYVLPTQLAPGDVVPVAAAHVVGSSGTARPTLARVTAVEELVEEGVFMPHTHTGAIVVDGVVASELTSLVPSGLAGPRLSHALASTLRLAFSALPASAVEAAVGTLSRWAHGTPDAAVSSAALFAPPATAA